MNCRKKRFQEQNNFIKKKNASIYSNSNLRKKEKKKKIHRLKSNFIEVKDPFVNIMISEFQFIG